MLARELRADTPSILTDVANIEIGFGTDSATPISHITPTVLRSNSFPAGSMGPKIDAVCRFVEATRHPAMIGRLDDAVQILSGMRGTRIETGTAAVQVAPLA